MKKLASALLATTLATVALPTMALAQEFDDLDADERARKSKKKKSKKAAKAQSSEIVREIERGYFLKAGAGMTGYLLTYGPIQNGFAVLRTGTTISLSVGNDFHDTEGSSMAWEVQFFGGVHNGLTPDQQVDNGVTNYIQGDTRTIGFMGYYEYSGYPSRRVGIGVRAGAGLIVTPLLMKKEAYLNDIVNGTWGGVEPSVHKQPIHPRFSVGPTFEYYTKLSHFSFGVDIDVSYAIGFDLGVGGEFFMKYSF